MEFEFAEKIPFKKLQAPPKSIPTKEPKYSLKNNPEIFPEITKNLENNDRIKNRLDTTKRIKSKQHKNKKTHTNLMKM